MKQIMYNLVCVKITHYPRSGCYRRFAGSENRNQNQSLREKIVKMTGRFVSFTGKPFFGVFDLYNTKWAVLQEA